VPKESLFNGSVAMKTRGQSFWILATVLQLATVVPRRTTIQLQNNYEFRRVGHVFGMFQHATRRARSVSACITLHAGDEQNAYNSLQRTPIFALHLAGKTLFQIRNTFIIRRII
jgi:hypothetical protein